MNDYDQIDELKDAAFLIIAAGVGFVAFLCFVVWVAARSSL